jgi:hypothetical protein
MERRKFLRYGGTAVAGVLLGSAGSEGTREVTEPANQRIVAAIREVLPKIEVNEAMVRVRGTSSEELAALWQNTGVYISNIKAEFYPVEVYVGRTDEERPIRETYFPYAKQESPVFSLVGGEQQLSVEELKKRRVGYVGFMLDGFAMEADVRERGGDYIATVEARFGPDVQLPWHGEIVKDLLSQRSRTGI